MTAASAAAPNIGTDVRDAGTMAIARSLGALGRVRSAWDRRGRSVGFVPTLGALHAGHLALIRRARRDNDKVVVSIFVNPLQFGPREDLARYPRPLARDAALCRAAGVDALYLPAAAGMYPRGFRSHVEVEGLSEILCGEFRPGHFRGVATVVLKLLQRVRPARAYFGEKDFQQLVIVRAMARDLDLPVRIVACPTVRERDGLALSSRNAYLSAEERRAAPELHRALAWGAGLAREGGAGPGRLAARVARRLRGLPGASVDYVRFVDAATLQPARRLAGKLRLLAAVRLGRTRLIDNVNIQGLSREN